MSRLLIVPPLRLDESVPFVADPSDQVLELLARRPNAVVSTLAALIVGREVTKVALLEPVAGGRDGGYGEACLHALRADLATRHIEVVCVASGDEAFATLRATSDGWVEVGPTAARRRHRLEADAALLLDDESLDDESPQPGAVERITFDGLLAVTVEVAVGAAIGADDILRAMHGAAERAVARHPGRYLIAQAELIIDAAGRRLLQWPGVAEHALADARSMAQHDGLALWWDALRVAPHELPAALFAGGPDCRDALAADLLGVPAARQPGAAPAGRTDSDSDSETEIDRDLDGDLEIDLGDDDEDDGGGGTADGGTADGGTAESGAAGARRRSSPRLLLPPPPAPPAFAPPPLEAARLARPLEGADVEAARGDTAVDGGRDVDIAVMP